MWDDEQNKRKRGQTDNIDPNDVLRQVDQQLNQAGIDLNLAGSGRRRRTGCGAGCGLFVILGVISFIGIFVFAFGVAFFPDFTKATSPVFCPKNTTLKTVEGAHDIDGTEVFFRCFDAENQMVEDSTGKVVLVIVGLAFLPFIFAGLGTLTAVGGVFGMARRYQPTVTIPAGGGVSYRTPDGVDVSYNVINLRNKMQQGTLTDADREQVAQVFKQFSGGDFNISTTGQVTERLRELQEAYSASLITKEEYDRKRQEILSQL